VNQVGAQYRTHTPLDCFKSVSACMRTSCAKTRARNLSLARVTQSLALSMCLIPCGCVSFSLPPPLSDREQGLVDTTHFHATIGVAEYRYPAWSDGLVGALRATGLFDRVERLADIQNPDLVAHVRGRVSHSNPLPLLPALTLGVIPIVDTDEQGQRFSLQSSRNPFVPPDLSDPHRTLDVLEVRTVRIEFRYTGTMHMGWIALFTGFLPSRTWFEPSWSSRYGDALAAHICAQAPAIRERVRESRATVRSEHLERGGAGGNDD
jgi:hypothetical protein